MKSLTWLYSSLIILFLSLNVSTAWAQQPYFAAPYSGKKVTQYEIELPVARGQKSTFQVPGNCLQLIEFFNSGASQWGNRVQRSIWAKATRDCHYYGFLNQFPNQPEHDFVSQYDFYNADFNDLPIERECESITDSMDCVTIPEGIRSLGSFIPFHNSRNTDDKSTAGLCQFKDGLFRGRLLSTPNGLRCQPDLKAPGCRILSVDLANVNGDNYQDVVLKLIPLGPSPRRTPILLPLTRTSKDHKFSIPNGVILPGLHQ